MERHFQAAARWISAGVVQTVQWIGDKLSPGVKRMGEPLFLIMVTLPSMFLLNLLCNDITFWWSHGHHPWQRVVGYVGGGILQAVGLFCFAGYRSQLPQLSNIEEQLTQIQDLLVGLTSTSAAGSGGGRVPVPSSAQVASTSGEELVPVPGSAQVASTSGEELVPVPSSAQVASTSGEELAPTGQRVPATSDHEEV